MTVTINGTSGITLPSGQSVPIGQSMVRLNTANGYGSTNTVIRRFTNTVVNQGTDITYTDSATLGATFTINTSGVYSVDYVDNFNTANSQLGISLNSSQLTTAVGSITVADLLAYGQAYAVNAGCSCSWTGYLAAGAVIRAHTSGNATGAVLALFTITKIA